MIELSRKAKSACSVAFLSFSLTLQACQEGITNLPCSSLEQDFQDQELNFISEPELLHGFWLQREIGLLCDVDNFPTQFGDDSCARDIARHNERIIEIKSSGRLLFRTWNAYEARWSRPHYDSKWMLSNEEDKNGISRQHFESRTHYDDLCFKGFIMESSTKHELSLNYVEIGQNCVGYFGGYSFEKSECSL